MTAIAPVLEAVAIAALFKQEFHKRRILETFRLSYLRTQEQRDDTIVDVDAWMRAEITK